MINSKGYKTQLLTEYSGLEPLTTTQYNRVIPDPTLRPHTHVNYYCVGGTGFTAMTYGLYYSDKPNNSSMMIPLWEVFEEVSNHSPHHNQQ